MFSLFTHDRLFIIQSALTHARGAGAGMRRPYAWNVDMTIYHTREGPKSSRTKLSNSHLDLPSALGTGNLLFAY
jgi:hypothetical protein